MSRGPRLTYPSSGTSRPRVRCSQREASSSRPPVTLRLPAPMRGTRTSRWWSCGPSLSRTGKGGCARFTSKLTDITGARPVPMDRHGTYGEQPARNSRHFGGYLARQHGVLRRGRRCTGNARVPARWMAAELLAAAVPMDGTSEISGTYSLPQPVWLPVNGVLAEATGFSRKAPIGITREHRDQIESEQIADLILRSVQLPDGDPLSDAIGAELARNPEESFSAIRSLRGP